MAFGGALQGRSSGIASLGVTLLWALVVGVVLGMGPHSSANRLVSSVVGGGVAALGIGAVRHRYRALLPAGPDLVEPPAAERVDLALHDLALNAVAHDSGVDVRGSGASAAALRTAGLRWSAAGPDLRLGRRIGLSMTVASNMFEGRTLAKVEESRRMTPLTSAAASRAVSRGPVLRGPASD